MSNVEVRAVDVHDETALRAWWEVGQAASAERPFEAWPAWAVSRIAMPFPRSDSAITALAAYDGARAVGSALLAEFLLDNTHLAEITVWVRPEHRRRGIATSLLAQAEHQARRDGRTTVVSSVFAPVGAESPGSLFAGARGYPVGSAEETKLLDVATAARAWPTLEQEADAARGDYSVTVFDAACPDEHVQGFADVLSRFIGEIPSGDLDLQDAQWTPERIRLGERERDQAGRVNVTALALAPDGVVCGFSDVRLNRADPRHGGVGGTLVLPEHRGHRLGLAMKLATHRMVQQRFPECAHIETGNAGVNAPMNAVNERMGYRVVERCLDVQKHLS
ncbi:GNAT family N-acetyltransferase [Nocardioides sp. JQ2195]|uniref:GNAT family N-acetyltransferase n=1 Tax=Nocardioides sp. JQ2195 TaxID=2592334 RepID=UPI00143E4990|nr:GNAT family N-acetyltransferase [Nocardioides sp. JQ2195]QIX25792.1 GNAT family N-acetyltransferase [Nocardioides sp. JQ2195]